MCRIPPTLYCCYSISECQFPGLEQIMGLVNGTQCISWYWYIGKLMIHHLCVPPMFPFPGLVPANFSGATMQKTSAHATWDSRDLTSEDQGQLPQTQGTSGAWRFINCRFRIWENKCNQSFLVIRLALHYKYQYLNDQQITFGSRSVCSLWGLGRRIDAVHIYNIYT